MILERRTNQGILKLNGGLDSCRVKPSVKDKGEKGPVGVDSNDGADQGKPQQEKTDEPNHVPSHTGITKPGPVTVSNPSAVEKTSPLASPGLGKVTYNPITHAPSMCTALKSLLMFSLSGDTGKTV